MNQNIATIDIAKLYDGCMQGKAKNAELKQVTATWREKFQSKEKEFYALRKTWVDLPQDDAEQRFTIERQLGQLDIELKAIDKQAQTDLRGRIAAARNALAHQARPIIEAYAKDKQLTAVIARQDPHLLFADQAIDITEEIIRLMDKA